MIKRMIFNVLTQFIIISISMVIRGKGHSRNILYLDYFLFQTKINEMGRPKGSKTKNQLDPANILEPTRRVIDENQNIDKNSSVDENQNIAGTAPPPKKKKPSVVTRRRSRDVQYWKDVVGPPMEFFPRTKLPQNKAVIQRYFSLRQELPPTQRICDIVNIIYTELVTEVWKPARIFTDKEYKCKRIITAVIKKFLKVQKNKTKGGTVQKKVKDLEEHLHKLCDLAPLNLKDMLKSTYKMNKDWEQDWKFYLNMCEKNQPGCVSGRDVKLATKEGKKQDRTKEGIKRAQKSGANKRKMEDKVSGDDFDDGTVDKDDCTDKDVVFKKKKKRAKLVLEIDSKSLVEQTTGTSDRLGLSARQTAMMLATVVKVGGGNLAEVPLTKSSVHRQRKKTRARKGKEIKNSFVHSDCGFVLHYDTKLVNPKGRDTEDRAAVLYSGGIHKQPYLLGIPKFKSSAGKDVEVGVLAQIEEYNIDVKDGIATCYDTTSSNSGAKEGAHFRIERRVGHGILELECRKHVQELHVSHANKAVFGATKGPQKAHYKRLKKEWLSMEHNTDNMQLFDWKKYSNYTFIIEKAKQSLAWASWHLEQKTFPRDDYKELNELIVVFLGGQVPGGFKPKMKGAMHEARFMADAIYILSMELFSNEFLMDQTLSEQVHKMSVFIAIWHGPNFLKCGLAATAPGNDLDYFYDMLQLSDSEDPVLSRIGAHVAESIQRHTSYLKAPQVVFALFDKKLSPLDRQHLASALHAIPRPDVSPSLFKPGKLDAVPLLCSIKECVGSAACETDTGELYPRKTLASFVSVKSFMMFNLIGIEDLTWLGAPVALWPCFPSYLRASSFVEDLLVVNDGAERGMCN